MSLTNYAENKMLTLFKGNATYYLALFKGNPGETGAVTNEVTGGDYSRQAISFGTPANGSMTNSSPIIFNAATANWGTITHWGVCDALSSGHVWWYGAVTAQKTVETGDIYMVDTGKLTLTID